MTDQQINAAIAEACGWMDVWRANNVSETAYFVGTSPSGEFLPVPDYCTDLNAMHEAEKMLKGYEQIHTYVWHLNNRKDWETDFNLMEVHISARDRAEAFLRTLGKWEEKEVQE